MYAIFFTLLLVSFSFAKDDLGELGGGSRTETLSKTDTQKTCESPKAALTTTFGGKSINITCFEKVNYSSGELLAVGERLAVLLKANEVDLDIKAAPAFTTYKDPETSLEQFALMQGAKPIYLEKSGDGRWIFPEVVIGNINALYKDSLAFNVTWLYDFVPEWAVVDFFGITGFNGLQIALLILLLAISYIIRFIIAFTVAWQLGKLLSHVELHKSKRSLRNACYSTGNLFVAGFLSVIIPGLDFNDHVTHYLILTLRLFAALSAVLLVYRSIDIITHVLSVRVRKTKSKMDDQLLPLLSKCAKVVVVIIGGIFVLQNLNVDVTSLLAGVTIGGLAFSFAAKDTIANIFGSVTIFSDKPFSIGDWIKIQSVEGTVEVIGFRSTRIRTFNDSLISMPNSKFTDEVVENFTVRKNRRTNTELSISYDTTPEQIEAFCNGIRAIIKAHPHTRKDSYEIHFIGYGDYALKIMLYFFTEMKSWTEELRMRHEIYLDIWRLAERMGVKFAFPSGVAIHPKDDKPRPSREALALIAMYFGPNGEGTIPPGPRAGEAFLAEGKPLDRGSHGGKS